MRTIGKILLALVGIAMLLPGLCTLIIMSFGFSDTDGFVRALQDLWLLWLLGLLVSAAGVKLIYWAFRKTQ